LLNCLEAIPYLKETELVKYLDSYNIQFLYQKTGFLLNLYNCRLKLSKDFIDYCKDKTSSSTRYLTKDSSLYLHEWRLVVPKTSLH
jgi:hypothetical protein